MAAIHIANASVENNNSASPRQPFFLALNPSDKIRSRKEGIRCPTAINVDSDNERPHNANAARNLAVSREEEGVSEFANDPVATLELKRRYSQASARGLGKNGCCVSGTVVVGIFRFIPSPIFWMILVLLLLPLVLETDLRCFAMASSKSSTHDDGDDDVDDVDDDEECDESALLTTARSRMLSLLLLPGADDPRLTDSCRRELDDVVSMLTSLLVLPDGCTSTSS